MVCDISCLFVCLFILRCVNLYDFICLFSYVLLTPHWQLGLGVDLHPYLFLRNSLCLYKFIQNSHLYKIITFSYEIGLALCSDSG